MEAVVVCPTICYSLPDSVQYSFRLSAVVCPTRDSLPDSVQYSARLLIVYLTRDSLPDPV